MSVRTETLAAGAAFEVDGGGKFFQCHYATAEIEFRVTIEGMPLGWVPLDRGIGWAKPWQKIEVRNSTASEQTVTVVHHNQDGYFDQRELAAQVAVNGSIQVVNSPSIDEGGAVIPNAPSVANIVVDRTGLGATSVDLISAVMNTSGVRVYDITISIWNVGASTSLRDIRSNNRIIWEKFASQISSNSSERVERPFDIPAVKSLVMYAQAEDNFTVNINYRNL